MTSSIRGRRTRPVVALAAAFLLALTGCGTSAPDAEPPAESAPSSDSSESSVPPGGTESGAPSADASGTRPPVTSTEAPSSTISSLTGLTASPGPVFAVKIDNTGPGRAQFGLADADIVYVEQVEAGITRLIAVFQSTLPTEVGPVRSVRSTDVELLAGYGTPGLVFSGGAGGPLSVLAESAVVSLSQDDLPGQFWRSDAASPPYNLHVDLTEMAAVAPDEGVGGAPATLGMRFQETDGRVSTGEPATDILVEMISPVQFRYAEGHYQVIHDEVPYLDAGDAPVVADNVLLQNVTSEPDGTVDVNGSPSYESHTVGEGTFTLFREGFALSGTWERPDALAPTKYLDEEGEEITFKPGKTWVLLAPENSTTTVD